MNFKGITIIEFEMYYGDPQLSAAYVRNTAYRLGHIWANTYNLGIF